jgi:hypothetical protein
MGIWIGVRPSYSSWPYYLPVPFIMTSLTSTKEKGFGSAETPAHPVRNSTDNDGGGRGTTFSQRIAWRNSNNITVVTPAAMETTTPVTPAATVATEATHFHTSGTDIDDDDQINPYESILQDAAKWKRELESARDEIYFLQVQNAMHLDYLTMAGAEE